MTVRTPPAPGQRTYWRVDGSLLELGPLRPIRFFTWNTQSFSERWARRAGMALMALLRPLIFAASRIGATRLLHLLLRAGFPATASIPSARSISVTF